MKRVSTRTAVLDAVEQVSSDDRHQGLSVSRWEFVSIVISYLLLEFEVKHAHVIFRGATHLGGHGMQRGQASSVRR